MRYFDFFFDVLQIILGALLVFVLGSFWGFMQGFSTGLEINMLNYLVDK